MQSSRVVLAGNTYLVLLSSVLLLNPPVINDSYVQSLEEEKESKFLQAIKEKKVEERKRWFLDQLFVLQFLQKKVRKTLPQREREREWMVRG